MARPGKEPVKPAIEELLSARLQSANVAADSTHARAAGSFNTSTPIGLRDLLTMVGITDKRLVDCAKTWSIDKAQARSVDEVRDRVPGSRPSADIPFWHSHSSASGASQASYSLPSRRRD